MRVELRVGQCNRRNLGIDTQRDHMVVDQLADLGAYVLAQNRRVFVAVAGSGVDVREGLGVLGEGQALRARQHHVQRTKELLELDGEFRAQPFVRQHFNAALRVIQ